MNLNTAGWASRALTPLLRIIRSSPNATVPVVVISEPVNSETAGLVNSDIALVAKGTGATLAQVPDGTLLGGNKRGAYATDWQKLRNFQTHVASGNYSVISGGERNSSTADYCSVGGGYANTASSTRATVSGGYVNTASGNSATVAGGNQNQANSDYSFVGGGQSNTASSSYSFVGGGQSNTASTNSHSTVCGGNGSTASGQYSFVGGGNSNTASGRSSFIGGGEVHTASGTYSAIMGGAGGNTRSIIGYHVFSACLQPISSASGSTQSALLLLGRQTTDATATVLTSNNQTAATTNQVTLPNNAAYYFRGSVISGVTGGGDSKAFTFEGAIKRGANAASTAIVGTVIINTIAQDVGAAAWTIAITADTTNGGIAVTFTGAAATTIRTVAKIETTEMTY